MGIHEGGFTNAVRGNPAAPRLRQQQNQGSDDAPNRCIHRSSLPLGFPRRLPAASWRWPDPDCGNGLRTVRLFRSDGGVGIVLLADRSSTSDFCHQQLLMHQRILQHIRDAVIVTTAEPVDAPDPVIVYANPAALRQTGYRLSEVLGRNPRLFHGPDTDPAALRTLHEALRRWQPVRETVLN
jgi:PAS domain-containing protein